MNAVAALAAHVREHDITDGPLVELVLRVQAEASASSPDRIYTALTVAAAGADVDAVFDRLMAGAEL